MREERFNSLIQPQQPPEKSSALSFIRPISLHISYRLYPYFAMLFLKFLRASVPGATLDQPTGRKAPQAPSPTISLTSELTSNSRSEASSSINRPHSYKTPQEAATRWLYSIPSGGVKFMHENRSCWTCFTCRLTSTNNKTLQPPLKATPR